MLQEFGDKFVLFKPEVILSGLQPMMLANFGFLPMTSLLIKSGLPMLTAGQITGNGVNILHKNQFQLRYRQERNIM
ncbi:hypothetical protein GO621_07580 [Mucilaginibacter sp. HMF7410]|uniref:Uncharacterized protein n=1 Tax=Mucilaginibacter arboris TaxID=2682090 RepID=A0A7K1SVS7_9SPHI|nr:hypothetical protein [Mucilaginibacter arboris]MVN21394.1 hypothetical protein [Mucilaginibacter arboris]